MYAIEKPELPAAIALEEEEVCVVLKVNGRPVLLFHKCDGSIERVGSINGDKVPFEVDSEGRAIIQDAE